MGGKTDEVRVSDEWFRCFICYLLKQADENCCKSDENNGCGAEKNARYWKVTSGKTDEVRVSDEWFRCFICYLLKQADENCCKSDENNGCGAGKTARYWKVTSGKTDGVRGADDGTWTHTTLLPLAPEASASANSATSAYSLKL